MNADSQLGGGCELALMCDIILASPTAKFGQPEINLGVIPGGGGSQRLIHAIGKSRTMELVLTGRMISAQEASDWGMVSRVVGEGEGEVVKEAINMANTIASKSQLAVQAGKEVVNAGARPFFMVIHLPLTHVYSAAYEMTLAEGLRFERRIFHGLFATNDQKEGTFVYMSKSSFVPVPDFIAQVWPHLQRRERLTLPTHNRMVYSITEVLYIKRRETEVVYSNFRANYAPSSSRFKAMKDFSTYFHDLQRKTLPTMSAKQYFLSKSKTQKWQSD